MTHTDFEAALRGDDPLARALDDYRTGLTALPPGAWGAQKALFLKALGNVSDGPGVAALLAVDADVRRDRGDLSVGAYGILAPEGLFANHLETIWSLVHPDRKALLVGDRVGAGYRLTEVLRAGGSKVVYLARNERDQLVVVQVCYPDPDLTARFQAEFAVTRELNAINTEYFLRVLDYGRAPNGCAFAVTTYAVGGALSSAERSDFAEPRAAAACFLELVTALRYMHAAGLIHRDVKPDNILVFDDGRKGGRKNLRLADQGLAKYLLDPPEGAAVGTPGFADPFLNGGDGDVMADLYSAGAVAYWMLTGAPPDWTRGTRTCRQALSGALGRIVWRCIRPDRAKRYATADELRRDLAAYVEGSGQPKATWKWVAAVAVVSVAGPLLASRAFPLPPSPHPVNPSVLAAPPAQSPPPVAPLSATPADSMDELDKVVLLLEKKTPPTEETVHEWTGVLAYRLLRIQVIAWLDDPTLERWERLEKYYLLFTRHYPTHPGMNAQYGLAWLCAGRLYEGAADGLARQCLKRSQQEFRTALEKAAARRRGWSRLPANEQEETRRVELLAHTDLAVVCRRLGEHYAAVTHAGHAVHRAAGSADAPTTEFVDELFQAYVAKARAGGSDAATDAAAAAYWAHVLLAALRDEAGKAATTAERKEQLRRRAAALEERIADRFDRHGVPSPDEMREVQDPYSRGFEDAKGRQESGLRSHLELRLR